MRRLRPEATTIDPLSLYLDDRATDGGRWVLANMVGSLAGSAATGGRVGALSTRADAVLFRAIRVVADVVLVGAETVRREHYGPVARPPDGKATPLAIVSRSLDLDYRSAAFTEAAERTIVVTCAAAPADRRAEAAEVADVIEAGDDRVEVAVALDALAERGHRIVLCEGGPTLLGELVAADLLDELCLTVSPVVGGDALPIVVGVPGSTDLRHFRLAHALIDEDDAIFLRYTRRREPEAPAR